MPVGFFPMLKNVQKTKNASVFLRFEHELESKKNFGIPEIEIGFWNLGVRIFCWKMTKKSRISLIFGDVCMAKQYLENKGCSSIIPNGSG